MKFFDRLLTIVVTATVTSMIWIVAGGSLIESADGESQIEASRPAEAMPSPQPSTEAASAPVTGPTTAEGGNGPNPSALNTDNASLPQTRDVGTLLIPVLNVRPSDLTDTFANSVAGSVQLHEALDIMAPEGTSVVASAPGTIEKLHRSNAGGIAIYVRSADRRTIHYYAHLSRYAEGLREGQQVRRGQRIGEVGSTGNAEKEAPHLHFAILRTTADAEWWEPANAVNPYPLLAGSR